VVLLAPATALAAGGAQIELPSSQAPTTLEPPFPQTGAVTEPSRLPRGRIDSDERVVVLLGSDGAPVAVNVRQRLSIDGRPGDYSFLVPGPISRARAAPGSAVPPGLRQDNVVWEGFSPGKRLLAADVQLRPQAAAAALPLDVSLTPSPAGLVLRLQNATAAPANAQVGPARAPDIAVALDRIRAAVSAGRPVPQLAVTLTGAARSVRPVIEAPLRVRGTLTLPPGSHVTGIVGPARGADRTVLVDEVLGDGRALSATIVVRGRLGAGHPRLRLGVDVLPPTRLLTPPAASWRAAAAAPRGPSGEVLLTTANAALLGLAHARQYSALLANPDTQGRSSASYVYLSAPNVPAVHAIVAPDHGGSERSWLLLLVAAPLLLVGLAVWWAHA
jgi:hypothetical protein